jgi:hypothetical protein
MPNGKRPGGLTKTTTALFTEGECAMVHRKVGLTLCAAMVAATFATQAMALDTTGEVKPNYAPTSFVNKPGNQGGEFEVNVVTGNMGIEGLHADQNVAGTFQTFCIEQDETFRLNRTYDVLVAKGAISGGPGTLIGAIAKDGKKIYDSGGNWLDMDPISDHTVLLYAQFRTGGLGATTVASGSTAGFQYGNASERKKDTEELQKAIWHFEDEQDDASNPWVDWANANIGLVNDDMRDDVFVLGLWDSVREYDSDGDGTDDAWQVSGYHQDMLTLETGDFYVLPTPAASLGGSALLGLLGVGSVIRRRRKKAG